MSCTVHTSGECQPSLTEEMILRDDYLPGTMKGWRRYRIEYGHECACPEGVIYLPPNIDPDEIEALLCKWAASSVALDAISWGYQ